MINIKNLYISILLPVALVLTLGSFGGAKAVADEPISIHKETFATIEFTIESKKIDRVGALEKFFQKYNSPLANHAETFVLIADKYKIDYKLLPSIACMESTCAKFLIPGTHNPFGWGAGRIAFASYDEAIEKVGAGLDKIYLSRGLDNAEKIAPVYNPPSPISWTKGVNYFTGKIEEISLKI
jgi:hypothetical protein